MYRLFIKCILTLTFFFTAGYVYPDNESVAREYIKRAYSNIGTNSETSGYFLSKSADFGLIYPEYYYLMSCVDNASGHFENDYDYAEGIVSNITNAFVIDSYELYKKAFTIYARSREYGKVNSVFDLMSGLKDRILYSDMISYLEVLFDSGEAAAIAREISEIRKSYAGADIFYYEGLYFAKYSDKEKETLQKNISKLNALEYDKGRLLYLESFTMGTDDEIKDLISQIADPVVPISYRKDIVVNLINNYSGTDDSVLTDLYKYWLDNFGNSDYRTFEIMNSDTAKRVEVLNPLILEQMRNHTGTRNLDIENDGIAELIYELKDGVIIGKKFDLNQDGIYERTLSYRDNGKIDNISFYTNKHDFIKYIFNKYDSSLTNVDFYEKGNKKKTIVPGSSSIFFTENGVLPSIDELLYISQYEELYDDGVVRKRYFNGKVASVEKDRDSDGYFEYKGIYEEGILLEGLIDTDKDSVFDTLEKFEAGKMVSLYAKSDPFYTGYDYKELIYDDRIEKYWDEDRDSNFEIKSVEYNDKTKDIYYDINFDNSYDYLISESKTGGMKTYIIRNSVKKIINQSVVKTQQKTKGWFVVSPADTSKLTVPEQIVFDGSKSGIFVYKGIKSMFENSVITTEDFSYIVMKNEFGIFLFDIVR